MPNYRRYYLEGQPVFITCVTYNRKTIFSNQEDIDLFYKTIDNVKRIHPFEFIAQVLLPDHFHGLIQTPNDLKIYSPIIHSLKRNFTWNYKKIHSIDTDLSIWQKRFWDHVIRDENDFKRHLDYIHWNPVKHGYVTNPSSWRSSSLKQWIENNTYEDGWGCDKPPKGIIEMDFE